MKCSTCGFWLLLTCLVVQQAQIYQMEQRNNRIFEIATKALVEVNETRELTNSIALILEEN